MSNKAHKFLEHLDSRTRKRVYADFDMLVNYPFWDKSLDIMKYEGEERTYRLRTGKRVRTIFKVDKDAEVILVRKIGFREAIYE
jgi:mRNA-degrading endonuclease RelE of RelBE toxin-antitoxin system